VENDMKMRIALVGLVSAGAMTVGLGLLASPASAQDLDCPDFPTQEAAQAEFDRVPGDPMRLDADGDGIACEDRPSGVAGAPAPAGESAPTGGVATGFGGLADEGSSPIWMFGLIGGAALLTVLGLTRGRFLQS
jgi:hypothetical protein